VKNKVITCPFVKGVVSFLKDNFLRYDFYIASGTPQQELEYIVKERKIRRYFKGIYGSPPFKENIINSIISLGYFKNNVIFVGDSRDDFENAAKCGVRFVGRIVPNSSLHSFKDDKKFFVIEDFCGFNSILATLGF
jgi:phosphoglycolate phosphatase-like HAD superfamily hydrolase